MPKRGHVHEMEMKGVYHGNAKRARYTAAKHRIPVVQTQRNFRRRHRKMALRKWIRKNNMVERTMRLPVSNWDFTNTASTGNSKALTVSGAGLNATKCMNGYSINYDAFRVKKATWTIWLEDIDMYTQGSYKQVELYSTYDDDMSNGTIKPTDLMRMDSTKHQLMMVGRKYKFSLKPKWTRDLKPEHKADDIGRNFWWDLADWGALLHCQNGINLYFFGGLDTRMNFRFTCTYTVQFRGVRNGQGYSYQNHKFATDLVKAIEEDRTMRDLPYQEFLKVQKKNNTYMDRENYFGYREYLKSMAIVKDRRVIKIATPMFTGEERFTDVEDTDLDKDEEDDADGPADPEPEAPEPEKEVEVETEPGTEEIHFV